MATETQSLDTSFRIYYGDGSIYEGPIADAPPVDVQCIITPDQRRSSYEVGRLVMHSWDFYLYVEGVWLGVNSMVDLVDHILHRQVEKVVKGRMIPNDRYEAILNRANTDEGFPRKSALSPVREDGRL